MEIVQSRHGQERTYEMLNDTTIRVSGHGGFIRTSSDDAGKITMYDFDGGPTFYLGGKVEYNNKSYTIMEISPVEFSVILTVNDISI